MWLWCLECLAVPQGQHSVFWYFSPTLRCNSGDGRDFPFAHIKMRLWCWGCSLRCNSGDGESSFLLTWRCDARNDWLCLMTSLVWFDILSCWVFFSVYLSSHTMLWGWCCAWRLALFLKVVLCLKALGCPLRCNSGDRRDFPFFLTSRCDSDAWNAWLCLRASIVCFYFLFFVGCSFLDTFLPATHIFSCVVLFSVYAPSYTKMQLWWWEGLSLCSHQDETLMLGMFTKMQLWWWGIFLFCSH